MSTAAQPRLVTIEEWARLPDDDRRELVDGVLVEDEMPTMVHEMIVAWLIRVVGAWSIGRGARVFASGGRFVVAPHRGRMPDATMYLIDAKRPPPSDVVRVPPSIAVEVVSATPRDSRRDRIEKLADYATFGVRYYWLIDPQLRSFEILELDADRKYRHLIAVVEGKIDPVPGCEGLALDIDALWADVDAMIAEGSEDDRD